MAKKTKTGLSKKEKTDNLIQKWAFGILFALMIELLVYVFILNIVPTMVKTTIQTEEQQQEVLLNPSLKIDDNTATVLNPFYKTDRCYTTNQGKFTTEVDNPTWIIYYYNNVLLVASILLILYYLVTILEQEKKVLPFLKKEWPFALLLLFMLWVFISSCLARDSYRSFVGCYNLKDGYLSFLMYGSMLICSMFLIKEKHQYKKILVNTFLITATILAILSLWNYFYLISDKLEPARYKYIKYGNTVYSRYFITYGEDASKSVCTLGELLFGNGGLSKGRHFMIVTKRALGEEHSGVFHNSNHYGYYLSISVVVAMVMALKSKKVWQQLLYFMSFLIMTNMAIINNTLGAYLGIAASIVFMLIYVLVTAKNTYENNSSEFITEGIMVFALILSFVSLSMITENKKGENIVYQNFAGISHDFELLVNYKKLPKTDDSNVDPVELEQEQEKKAAEGASTQNQEVREVGSGRGKLWYYGLILATQKPFGYGLENIIYEYSEQFDIGEGRSHNLVIQLAATTGIVGMLLYIVGIASIWIRRLKYIKTWDIYECLGMFVIVSYMISSFFGNSGFYTSPYFYLFVGFVILSRENVEK